MNKMKHQCDNFYLFTDNDESIKRTLELVEKASVDKLKVCVVSIIGRTPIDSSAKLDMINTLLGRKAIRCSNISARTSSENNDTAISDLGIHSVDRNNDSAHGPAKFNNTDAQPGKPLTSQQQANKVYENQIVGLVDTKASVIVLQLSSFLDTEHMNTLVEHQKDFFKDETLLQCWPQLNQNLVKTMLIMYLLSHIIVVYSPEPNFDAQSIRLFRILEDIRKRSQPRVCDLLEVLGTPQTFPQSWIKSGRLSCPRTLFVFDATSYSPSIDINQAERNLEDHIYKLLRKSGIISKHTNDACSLFCLPPRDNFVFLVTKDDLNSIIHSRPNETERRIFDASFYNSLLKQLTTQDEEERGFSSTMSYLLHQSNRKPVDDGISRHTKSNHSPNALSNSKNNNNNNNSNKQQTSSNRFKKFIKLHIDQALRATSMTTEHGSTSKTLMAGPQIRQAAFTLPRTDNFLKTMIKIKNLLFPSIDNPSTITKTNSNNTATTESNCDIWRIPDERRFVDIYDLFDTDKVFSEVHCIKVYNASLELYIRGNAQCYDSKYHQNKSDLARKFYAIHARGFSYHVHLAKLIEQCELIWNDRHRLCEDPGCHLFNNKPNGPCNNPQHHQQSTPIKASLPNGSSSTSKRHHHSKDTTSLNMERSSILNPHTVRTSHDDSSIRTTSVTNKHSRSSFDHHAMHIMRSQAGVKFTTSCECGRKQTFVITPKDKKKKLERIDIEKLQIANDI